MFRYICTQRPPMPGGIPRGAVNIEYGEGYMEDFGGHTVRFWGAVEYSRPLSDKEVEDYELIFDGE